MYAWALPAHLYNEMGSDQSAVRSWPIVVWIRSFIERDLLDNNMPFDNTTPIYLINLLWKLGLGLGSDLELHYFHLIHGA